MSQHRGIPAAVEAGGPDWAGNVMTSHVAAAQALLLRRGDLATPPS